VRLLHTSDWHVGKKIRGHSRHDEHVEVLSEIVGIAEDRDVDVVIVAGDLFETAAPTPESEALVYSTLLDLADLGTSVVVIAGNHDNARRLRAVAPVFRRGDVLVVSEPTAPDAGGSPVLDIDGVELRLALLPFVSQRGIIRAAELMSNAAFENANAYAARVRALIDMLTADFSPAAVNVIVAHGFVAGGATGGGERAAHLLDEYAVTAQAFPASASYVALGHLHRPQKIAGAAPIHYCGSPLQLDFGEQRQRKQVNVVDAEPGAPASVDAVTLTGGRGLRTISGTIDELRSLAGDDDDWLRVRVDEARRPDLAQDVRAVLGDRVVDIEVIGASDAELEPAPERRVGRDPVDLFGEYLHDLGIEDDRLRDLFVELLDDRAGGS